MEWKFGFAAIIANFHDVIIILGFLPLFQWEFSLAALAAVLAVLGYSVNESVVVFDRIRENFRDMDLNMSVKDVINSAITKNNVKNNNTSWNSYKNYGNFRY